MYTTKSAFQRSNYEVNQTISWKMLSNDQCEEIFVTASELLEHTGAAVANEEARKIFADNGCWVDGEIVRIPSNILYKVLQSTPGRITLFGRDGKRAVRMETESVHWGPGYNAKLIVDRKTGEPREITLEDIEDTAKLCEKLVNVAVVSSPGNPAGIDEKTAPLTALAALLKYTSKPIIQPVCCGKQAEQVIRMVETAVGNKEKLRRDPSLVLSIECAEPRYHSDNAMSAVITAAKEGIPFIYQNNLIEGQTAPSEDAATLVLALSNTLVALTLAQLIKPGAPVIAGGQFSFVDEKNDMVPYGAPEVSLLSAGFANLMHYLHIPNSGIAGVSDSAISDAQSGAELAMGLLTSALGGTNIIQGGGLLEGGKQFSFSVLSMSDEVMSLIFRIMKSMEVDEDHMAVGVYDVVEPGGHYLGEDHTMVYFKSEQFWPNLFQRLRIDDWTEAGSKQLGQRALEHAEQLLAMSCDPVIDDAVADKVKAVVSSAQAEK